MFKPQSYTNYTWEVTEFLKLRDKTTPLTYGSTLVFESKSSGCKYISNNGEYGMYKILKEIYDSVLIKPDLFNNCPCFEKCNLKG